MRTAIGGAAVVLTAGAACAQPWLQFARDASRSGTVTDSLASLGQPRWVLSQLDGQAITFVGQASVATDGLRVYASGRVNGQQRLLAIAQDTGAVDWWAPLSAAFVDSWSSAAVDLPRGIVLAASGRFVTALDLGTGSQRWQTELARNIVNASPLVVSELGRAFITDYDGFGTAASLYCINLLPQSASQPHAPGAIVWSVPIGGSSGNSPTYADGKVFVAAAREPAGGDAGAIYAYPADAATARQPLWTFTNVQQTGFFGGVAVRNGAVYAASYALYGGQLSANLVKVDAATGSLVWSIPSNRTDSTPLVLPDGRIALSTGIMGFGSAPSIQLFGLGAHDVDRRQRQHRHRPGRVPERRVVDEPACAVAITERAASVGGGGDTGDAELRRVHGPVPDRPERRAADAGVHRRSRERCGKQPGGG